MSIKEGVYWIRNLRWKHKVLDLSGGSLAADTKIENLDQQDTFNALLNQLWTVEAYGSRGKHLIRNIQSSLVLDLQEADPDNGTPIVCSNQKGGANQQWRIEWSGDEDGTAYYQIINMATSKAVSHELDDSGNSVVGWTVDGGGKQVWGFIPFVAPLTYRLRVKSTGRVLDLAGASSSENGTPASANDRHTVTKGRNQLWWLPIKPGSEGYTIQNFETSTVADLSTSDNGITGWKSHGGPNQQWKMKTLADGYQEITNVASGLVMDANKDDKARRVGGEQPHGGGTQQWFLDPIPSPGPGWVFIQNGGTGKFLASYNSGKIGTKDGPWTVGDPSVQWKFLQKDNTGFYTLFNRSTGAFLRQLPARTNSISLVKTDNNEPEARDWWILENYHGSDAGLVSIISKHTENTLDHYGSKKIEALDKKTDNINRAWKIIPSNDWLPSFSLINGESGHSLGTLSGDKKTTLTFLDKDGVEVFRGQWIFRKAASGPLFSIHNKNNNTIMGGDSARWQLVAGRGKYFALLDTKTKKYLGIDSKGQPTLGASSATSRAQAWELVAYRATGADGGLHDVLYLDDDLVEALVSLLHTVDTDERDQITANLGGRRATQKPAKQAADWKTPTRARVMGPDNPILRQLLHALIDRWEWDDANAWGDQAPHHPAQTLASIDLATAETTVTGQRLPPSLRRVFDNNTSSNPVLRLDRQGYVTMPNDTNDGEQRYANLQGRWGGHGGHDVYFHVALPVGVAFGREQIRGFLRDSLERSTTVVVTPTTCKAPEGGPEYQRSAGVGGSGNEWVGWVRALLTGTGVRRSEL